MTDIGQKWIRYEGNFRNGVREGYGTLIFAEESKYVGNFKNNLPNGIGKFIKKDKEEISTNWINGIVQENWWSLWQILTDFKSFLLSMIVGFYLII